MGVCTQASHMPGIKQISSEIFSLPLLSIRFNRSPENFFPPPSRFHRLPTIYRISFILSLRWYHFLRLAVFCRPIYEQEIMYEKVYCCVCSLLIIPQLKLATIMAKFIPTKLFLIAASGQLAVKCFLNKSISPLLSASHQIIFYMMKTRLDIKAF